MGNKDWIGGYESEEVNDEKRERERERDRCFFKA